MSAPAVADDQDEAPRTAQHLFWVAAYLVSHSFGGGEEGGWHYDDCELVTEPHVYARLGALPAAFVTWEEAEKHAAEMEKGLAEINQGRPPKHSILSQGVYEVLVLEAAVPPGHWPERPPRYE